MGRYRNRHNKRVESSTIMGKLRQWFRNWFDIQIEKSWQRKANRQFNKHSVKYRDGDNT